MSSTLLGALLLFHVASADSLQGGALQSRPGQMICHSHSQECEFIVEKDSFGEHRFLVVSGLAPNASFQIFQKYDQAYVKILGVFKAEKVIVSGIGPAMPRIIGHPR